MDSSRKATEQNPSVLADSELFGAEVLHSMAPRQLSETELERPPAPEEHAEAVGRLWAARIFLVVYVVVCIWVGMFLAVVPWTRVWTENNIVMAYPTVRALANNDFLRGLVTGLGLVDIWLGIWEAVHYHEPSRQSSVASRQ